MKRFFVLIAFAALIVACESVIDANFDVTRVSCTHRAVPPRPAPGNYNNNSQPITVGVRHVNLGDDGTWPHIGLDQDGVCTNQSQRGSCQRATWAAPADVTDGDDGIDNASGSLLGGLSSNFGTAIVSTERISAQIESGDAPPMIVLRISDYNGTFTDDQLKVEWFTPGLVGEDKSTVKWDGSYPVPIDSRSVDANGQPYYVDTTAYASKGSVIAHFETRPDHPLFFRLGKTTIFLQYVTLVLEVPAVGATFVKGVYAGAIKISELLRQISGFTGAENIGLICTDNTAYAELKRYFCSYSDIASQSGADSPCDLISFGFDGQLAAVKVGAVIPPEKLEQCAAGTDPGEDTCAGPAGTADAAPADDNCVKAGTPNNELGLGAPCFETSDCPGTACSFAFGSPLNARFCTRFCTTAADCGSGMQCLKNGGLMGCVPDACAPKDGG